MAGPDDNSELEPEQVPAGTDIGDTPSIALSAEDESSADESNSALENFIVTGGENNTSSQNGEGAEKFVVSDAVESSEEMIAMDGLDSTPADPVKEQEEIGLSGDEPPPPAEVTEPAVQVVEDVV